MQHLTMEHKYTTTQVVKNKVEIKDRREGKGRVLAISRNVYHVLNSDVYYVESESGDSVYYFVKFKPDVESWCSYKDNSTRGLKCKHLFAIEFAIKWGTIKEIDKVPTEKPNDYPITTTTTSIVVTKSYIDDDYSF